MRPSFPIPCFRLLALGVLLALSMPMLSEARGIRGGGGFSRPAARPAPRPAPTPRPAPRPTPMPARPPATRPAVPHQPINRTPAITPGVVPRPAIPREPAVTLPVRPENPELRPLFEGNRSDRRAEARDRMDQAMDRDPGSLNRRPDSEIQQARLNNRAKWGASVRNRAAPLRRSVFNPNWVNQRINLFPQRWFYWHRPHPAYWWWRGFVWGRLTAWINYAWADPFYYDYGYSVYYEDQTVFVNEEPVAAYDDYVASAAELADRFEEPPDDAETEWEPLGTWMLSTDANAQDADMMLQLVLSQEGQISGTYYHIATDSTRSIRGALDNATQRLAFTIGEDNHMILETGIASLTREEAPVWVHFLNEGNSQNWLMIRLESPEGEA